MGSVISSSTFHARVAEGKEDISNIRKAHNETAFADSVKVELRFQVFL